MKKLAILAAVAVLVGLPSWAAAEMVGPINSTTSIATNTLTDWGNDPAHPRTPRYLTFTQFDPSLGTLYEVDIRLIYGMDTVVTVTNNSDSSSFGTAKTEVDMFIQTPLGNIPTDPPPIARSLPSPVFSYNLGPGGSTTSTQASVSNQNGFVFLNDQAVLDEFTGNSTIQLSAYTFTHTWLDNSGGNTSANQTTHAGLNGKITYYYDLTPVPAPPTLLLLGSGLVGLLALRRRRKVSKS